LNRLNAKTVLPPGETRGVTVIVRAFIADAPARAWQCGIKTFSGFLSCPRCKIVGVHPKELLKQPCKKPEDAATTSKNAETVVNGQGNNASDVIQKDAKNVKFPEIRKDGARLFSEWPSYLFVARGQKSNMRHRIGTTPLDNIMDVDPIYDVPLEEMHLMDLGVYRDTSADLLNLKVDKKLKNVPKKRGGRRKKTTVVVGIKKKTLPKTMPVRLRPWTNRIRVWSKLTPKEFGRKLSPLEYFSQWKANEYRQFFLYYFIPLAIIDKGTLNPLGFEVICNINRAIRLVTGNTHKKVPEHRVELSKDIFCTAFYQMKHLTHGSWCTYKCHCMWHMPDDCIRFGCHLGSLSAYCFENQMIHFRRMGLSGNNIIQQVTNRLSERSMVQDFDNDDDQWDFDEQSFECFFEKIKRNETSPQMTVSEVLDLPSFFVHEFNSKRQIVKCEAYTITNTFPNNVVRLHFNGKNRRRKNAFVVDEIFRDSSDGELKMYVREFVKLTDTFQKPYPSSYIGNFFATGGLKANDDEVGERKAIRFSQIIGKYFAFPTILCSRDKNDKYNPSDINQKWILQEIMH
jgi:hypothetical protein